MLSTRKFKVITLLSLTIITLFTSIRSLKGNEEEIKDKDLLSSFNHFTDYYPSNRYTHKDDLRIVENKLDIDPLVYKYLTTTELGDIYLNEEDLSFRFKNPKTNYIWGSTIDVEGQKLTTVNKQKARSAINVSYFDEKNNSFEESLFTSKETKIEINKTNKGFDAKIYFGTSKIKMNLIVTFTDTSIKVDIPSSSIEELGDKKLKSIKVYSYFGAVNGDEIPGYMFVPDGVGALIRYDPIPEDAYKNYYKEIYDEDFAFLKNYRSDGEIISYPVFGFVHGVKQNGILGIIEKGATSVAINATHASKVLNFYTIYPEFIYRRTFRQPINAAGHEISLLQNYRNDIDVSITYEVLSNEDATYIGMANKYREYLISNNILNKQIIDEDQIPLNLDVILNEKKRGIFFDEKVTMTKFSEYNSMLKELKEKNINNINSLMIGYTHVGYSYTPPYYEEIDRDLGSLNIFDEDVLDKMYFRNNFIYGTNKVGNYNAYTDLAMTISEQIYTFHGINYTFHLLSPNAVSKIFTKSIKKMNKNGIKNLALEGVTNLLYSDHRNKVTSRDDVINLYQNMLKDYEYKIAMHRPNDYLYEYMDSYFDFPLYNSQYLSFDDTVPFLAIVLKGYSDLFAEHANFYPNARDEVLRLIDFGVFPSFVISHKSAHYLLETNLDGIFTSRFEDLKDSIVTYYHFVNDALSHVRDASIVNRKVISDGVIKVSYDNGYEIYVNYTSQDYLLNGEVIEAKNYVVRGASK